MDSAEDDSDSDHDPLGLAEASQHEVKELLTGRPHGSEQTSRYAFTCACISVVLPQHLPTRCSICRNICRHPSFSAAMSHYAATYADTHLFLPQHLPQILHVLPQHVRPSPAATSAANDSYSAATHLFLPQCLIMPQHLPTPIFFCRNICRKYFMFCRNICPLLLPQHLPQITIILPQHLAAPSFFCRNICRQYLLFCRNICRHGS
jgi:hypothetical protein